MHAHTQICTYVYVLGHTCEGHRTRYGSHFSPFSTGVLELELRSLCLGASTFTCCAVSPAPKSNVLNMAVPLFHVPWPLLPFFPFLFLLSLPHPFSFCKTSFRLLPPFCLLLVTYPINADKWECQSASSKRSLFSPF